MSEAALYEAIYKACLGAAEELGLDIKSMSWFASSDLGSENQQKTPREQKEHPASLKQAA